MALRTGLFHNNFILLRDSSLATIFSFPNSFALKTVNVKFNRFFNAGTPKYSTTQNCVNFFQIYPRNKPSVEDMTRQVYIYNSFLDDDTLSLLLDTLCRFKELSKYKLLL